MWSFSWLFCSFWIIFAQFIDSVLKRHKWSDTYIFYFLFLKRHHLISLCWKCLGGNEMIVLSSPRISSTLTQLCYIIFFLAKNSASHGSGKWPLCEYDLFVSKIQQNMSEKICIGVNRNVLQVLTGISKSYLSNKYI